MIRKNGQGSGYAGSYDNGYAVIIVSSININANYMSNNIVLMALSYRHISNDTPRCFRGWSVNHEICFKNGSCFGTDKDDDIASCGFLGELLII
eukprot:TRINITY_DN15234_c0_g1_i1.p1 TRINITY_DN15234_c0_g1~~TRINITY_DN15234_c0_g1_i1.p1  ORF type:complete len:103 (+),score=11.08 TRINITY_DN15234_c0_g1_i1:28-309(+)